MNVMTKRNKKFSFSISILLYMIISIILSGCYPYIKTLYDVVPAEDNNDWRHNFRNSFFFSCCNCTFNLDFYVVYEHGDHIFLEKTEKNPLLCKTDIKNERNIRDLNKKNFELSEKSILLLKNSVPVALADFREEIYQEYTNKFYYYEYQLPEFDPESNFYSMRFDKKLKIFDSDSNLMCACSIPSFNFRIIKNKELWIWFPGHAGPLF